MLIIRSHTNSFSRRKVNAVRRVNAADAVFENCVRRYHRFVVQFFIPQPRRFASLRYVKILNHNRRLECCVRFCFVNHLTKIINRFYSANPRISLFPTFFLIPLFMVVQLINKRQKPLVVCITVNNLFCIFILRVKNSTPNKSVCGYTKKQRLRPCAHCLFYLSHLWLFFYDFLIISKTYSTP